MVAKKTLQRYIKQLDDVIKDQDSSIAEKLQEEIIVALDSELDGLKKGLSNYGFIALYSDPRTGKTINVGDELDFIKDAKLLRARLQAEIDKYSEEKGNDEMPIRSFIFISHRSTDADIADMIKDFLVNTGIPNDRIFCSSLPGNDVKKCISTEVKQRLQESIINILILSKDYYESAYCLNEAGIAWYLQDNVETLAVCLPEINDKNMIGFFGNDNKIRRLDNENDVAAIYDLIRKKLNIDVADFGIVTREKQKLVQKYNDYLSRRSEEQSIQKSNELFNANMDISTNYTDLRNSLNEHNCEDSSQMIINENQLRTHFFKLAVKYNIQKYFESDPQVGFLISLAESVDMFEESVHDLLRRAPMITSSMVYYDIKEFIEKFQAYQSLLVGLAETKNDGRIVVVKNNYFEPSVDQEISELQKKRFEIIEIYKKLQNF